MVLPGHLAGGYLATYALFSILKPIGLSPTEMNALLFIGTLAGELPDIDLFFFYWQNRNKKNVSNDSSHRNYKTHTPFFWLIISMTIIVIGYFLDSTFTSLIGLTVLAGSWSHLIIDTIECGIAWLWPFYKKRFYIFKEPTGPTIKAKNGTLAFYWEFIWKIYIRQVSFYIEILIVLVALWVFLK